MSITQIKKAVCIFILTLVLLLGIGNGFSELSVNANSSENIYSIEQVNTFSSSFRISLNEVKSAAYFNIYKISGTAFVNPTPVEVTNSINSMPALFGNIADLEIWVYSDIAGTNLTAKFILNSSNQLISKAISTPTPTPSPTATATATPSPTLTLDQTPISTQAPILSPTQTQKPKATPEPTLKPTLKSTPKPTLTPEATPIPKPKITIKPTASPLLAVSKNTNITSSKYKVDKIKLSVTIGGTKVELNKFKSNIKFPKGATYKVLKADGKTIFTKGNVVPGMKLKVIAVDRKTFKIYKIIK